MANWGLIINGKHTFTDYGLGCSSCELTAPTPRTYSIDIPGADGDLDTTAARGRVTYKNRTLTAVLECHYPDRASYDAACASLNTDFHGRSAVIVLDSDAEHYLTGRIAMEHSSNGSFGTHTLTAECQPYRMHMTETVRPVSVATSQEVTLLNSQKAVIPVFETTASNMRVQVGTSIYSIRTGSFSIPEVYLSEGINKLTLLGTGTVTIRYREGDL